LTEEEKNAKILFKKKEIALTLRGEQNVVKYQDRSTICRPRKSCDEHDHGLTSEHDKSGVGTNNCQKDKGAYERNKVKGKLFKKRETAARVGVYNCAG